VLLGDFNIYNLLKDAPLRAHTDAGWAIPEELRALPGTNAPKTKHYDEIALRPHPHWCDLIRAGIFDYCQSLYRDEDETTYRPDMGAAYRTTWNGKPATPAAKRTYYRPYQLSDHLPHMGRELHDYSGAFLADVR
jgi:hypothetical protein